MFFLFLSLPSLPPALTPITLSIASLLHSFLSLSSFHVSPISSHFPFIFLFLFLYIFHFPTTVSFQHTSLFPSINPPRILLSLSSFSSILKHSSFLPIHLCQTLTYFPIIIIIIISLPHVNLPNTTSTSHLPSHLSSHIPPPQTHNTQHSLIPPQPLPHRRFL